MEQKQKETDEMNSALTLTDWIIRSADADSYRAGKQCGMKHPKVSGELIRKIGGRQALLRQAKSLEQAGLIRADWRDMGADIDRIHYSVEIIPELCKRAGTEDPRERQLRFISQVSAWLEEVRGTFLETYYEGILKRLSDGKKVKDPDLEDLPFFHCLNAIVHLQKPVWKRVFSASIFGSSKKFESKEYEPRILTVLRTSPLCDEEMEDDEVLRIHGILTYSQTLEWKGPLRYRLEDGTIIDSSANKYGTVLNAQTIEHALPCALPGVKQILVIENKANYEDMTYSADILYIFCHGFFSPKEVRFLKKLAEITETGAEYLHWGDMDFGGIRIFRFNQQHIFPDLKPYRMDPETFTAALNAGAAIPLPDAKRTRLEKMAAGDLEALKQCILENGAEIEQEVLLAAAQCHNN